MPPKNPGRDTAQPPISNFFKKASQPSNQSSSTSLSSGLNSSYKDEIDIIESARPKKKRRTETSPGEIIDLETHSDEDISQTSTRTKVQPTASNSTSSLTLADNVKQRAEAIDIASNPARSQSQRCTAPGITVDANAKPIPRADVSRPSSSSRINIFRASKSSGNEQLASAEQKKRHELWQSKLSQGMIIPRRNSLPLDQAAGMENDQDVGLDEMEDRDEEVHGNAKERKEETVKTVKGKKKEEVGPSGMAYTPLEKQFMQIKGENPDVLLLTEVGYKFKFLGDDAKIASKELGIACFPFRNFYSASIPVHRLPIHVKKLIARGYKVGVVRQTETAALKAVGDNRNKPFERRLTSLYTAATYVDDSSLEEDDLLTDPSRLTNTFLCLTETCAGVQSQDVRISLVGVTIGTGDVVYDDFTDTLLRNELETRLAHLSPTEILLPDDKLSKATEKTVGSWTKKAENTTTTGTRLERFAFPISREKAMKAIEKYHQIRQQQRQVDALNDPIDISSDGETEQPELLSVTQLKRLPSGIVLCIAAAMKHLERFGLENALLHLEAFRELATQTSMLLSANTLANLEIYRNQTDQGLKGSLLWLMDQTRTKMGKRLLRDWIGRPLVDRRLLEERLDAVTELKDSSSLTLDKLRSLLKGATPDLSRGLSRIQYGRATPSEVATILLAFQRLASEFEPELPTGTPNSSLLTRIAKSFPRIKAIIDMLLNQIDIRKARSDRPEDMFRDTSRFPAIGTARSSIAEAEIALDKHLKDIRKETKMGTLQYVTVAGIEHLIELKLKVAVPDNWVKVSATKTAARYHTPFVVSRAKELERGKESLMMAGKRAFLDWQEEISRHCEALREATLSIATFDCLSSLAKVAIGSGTDYCRPNFVEESTLDLEGVRHPMSELLIDNYVANDVKFSESTSRLMILTGPNMAGKTSFTRAVALCLVMAQVGSYMPCAKAVLSIHDAIWTRMGASDDLARNRSTFMVELKETSDILSGATSKSFVVLDELGRGTSTADGTAIAWAVLDYLARKRCNTIFTTHFPSLARIKDQYNKQVSVQHMGFTELRGDDGYPEIVFLYKLFPSLSLRSFGTYVGRLAGLDVKILRAAEEKSEWMRLHKGRESSERIGYRVGEQWSRLGGPSQDIWKAIQDLLEQAKKVPCRR